jgi:hypothetical protein
LYPFISEPILNSFEETAQLLWSFRIKGGGVLLAWLWHFARSGAGILGLLRGFKLSEEVLSPPAVIGVFWLPPELPAAPEVALWNGTLGVMSVSESSVKGDESGVK